ncbi:PQQ-binding-like beta-propeller repeat protein [Ruania alba]|uniref:PQQ-like domain-containing protein n=1 Tax=Ruania alba TaxID=648782 RepID=A0A1H5G9T2_9MICO|nr:PQQ-binding-like beta-propeller repeat protein [Ruania alba]SEE12251.1 PQQ-like domain-containing protein [Ruania alba]
MRGIGAGTLTLGLLGVALCALTLWRGWSPVAWWFGVAMLAVAMITTAWRREERRAWWAGGAVAVALLMAAVPVVEPLVRPQAEVAWSLQGTEEPVGATESLILTVDGDRLLRARAADDGSVAWDHPVPMSEAHDDAPVDVVGDVVLIGAHSIADMDEEMLAVDAGTGAELWTGPARIAPFVHDGTVLAAWAYDDGDVHRGIDLNTGEVLWSNPGSRGAYRSVPARTPGGGVPAMGWLVEVQSIDGDRSHVVTDVRTGDQMTVPGSELPTAFGIVGDQLIVHALEDSLEELRDAEILPSEVTAYDLTTGDRTWSAPLQLGRHAWGLFADSTQLTTVDGTTLLSSADGLRLDVLHLTDGGQVSVPSPSGQPFLQFPQSTRMIYETWVHGNTAVGLMGSLELAVVDLEAGTAALVPDPPFGSVAGTTWINGRPAPVWEEPTLAPFGREYDQLTAVDVHDPQSPERVDLGALPDGTVAGTFAERVVVVASTDEGSAATAMHVLAPSEHAR